MVQDNTMVQFELPSKLPIYGKRLHAHYSQNDHNILRDIMGSSLAHVEEETTYDNWDGGTSGHDVHLFLTIEELSKVDIDDIKTTARTICDDLNKVSEAVQDEFFANVHLDVLDEDDEKCQRAEPLLSRPSIDPDALSIWKKGMVRLFITHRDEHKTRANELAKALVPYGISSFVAHDSIQPMTIWQTEIVNGLETMDVLLAFITDDLHNSIWANQEIGFALGRNVPIIPLKLQDQDPGGFIGKHQALKCKYDEVAKAAPQVYKVLGDKLGNAERLNASLISAFVESPGFIETKQRFNRMRAAVSRLTDADLAKIVNGFRTNAQLHNAYHLKISDRLRTFLKDTTGKEFIVEGKKIIVEEDSGMEEAS